MTVIHYHMDKVRLVKGTAGALAFLVIGVLAMLHEGPRDSLFKDAMLGVALIPFFAFFLLGLSCLFNFGPAIEISPLGIKWNVSLFCRGKLEWLHIKSVSCVQISGVWFVNFELHDLSAFLQQQPLLRRALYRAMLRYKWPVAPTSVPGTGLRDGSAGAIAKRARRYLGSASNNSFKPKPLRGSA